MKLKKNQSYNVVILPNYFAGLNEAKPVIYKSAKFKGKFANLQFETLDNKVIEVEASHINSLVFITAIRINY